MGVNDEYRRMAHHYIPAGAHTYSRADDAYPACIPSVLDKGKGAFVWDLEGNRYLDYGMALRAVTVGYNYDPISEAAIAQIRLGNELTRASKTEVDAARLLSETIPWAEMVKFAKNGSTVTSAAVKLARAYTGRPYIARCAQHPFFSFDDWFIGDTIMNAGVPQESRSLTLRFDYNDPDSLKSVLEAHAGQVAGVILEPATTEAPKEDFLNAVKTLCYEHGAVFILDEMITGFRWHLQGAAQVYGVVPDLVTYGKGMANGFSVAALCGKKEIMELGGIHHDRERVFLISTTHGAEMCGLGAFMETVNTYRREDVTGHLWSYGHRFLTEANGLVERVGLSSYVEFTGVPCSPGFLTRDAEGAVSLSFRTLFIQEMARSGVLMPWLAFCLQHTDVELQMTLEALERTLSTYGKALRNGISGYLQGEALRPVFRRYNRE